MGNSKLNQSEIAKLKSFIDMASDHSQARYLVCPLVGINLNGVRNASQIDVAVSKLGNEVYLHYSGTSRVTETILKATEFYQYDITIDDVVYFVYTLPSNYIPAIKAIMEGKYTKIPTNLKLKICSLSGLPFNHRRTNFYNSSTLLLALFSKSSLRTILATYLDVKVSDLPEELISKIPEDSDFYIENRL